MVKRVWFTRCPCQEVFLLHLQEQLGLDRRNQWDFIGIEAIGSKNWTILWHFMGLLWYSVLRFYVIFGDSIWCFYGILWDLRASNLIGFVCLWDFAGLKNRLKNWINYCGNETVGNYGIDPIIQQTLYNWDWTNDPISETRSHTSIAN